MLPDHPQLTDAQLLEAPYRHGNERRTRLRLADGREAVLGELVDELAAQDSLRRRYYRDIERIAALDLPRVAPLLAWGPTELDASGPAPWRLRPEIHGESLQDWIDRHAPVPPALLAAKLIALCDLLAPLHARGLVIRDLSPAKIIEDQSGELWVLDVGLARTDLLSTRTAASLVLEGSPYAAPELLERSAVDGRADIYALGVLGFVALTGQQPFPDAHALLRAPGPAPAPSSVCPDVPAALDALIVAMLEYDPSARPQTVSLVAAILRGLAELPSRALARVSCQSCSAPLPAAQRLCLGCGKLAVRFRHAAVEQPFAERYKLVLRKAKESNEFMSELRELCAELVEGELPPLNFVIGDARMYSEAERKRALGLPLTLFNDLDASTARELQVRFEARGIRIELEPIDATNQSHEPVKTTRRQRRPRVGIGATTLAIAGVVAVLPGIPLVAAAGVLALGGLVFGAVAASQRKSNRTTFERHGHGLLQLRSAPAALPASDPLVARLAALLDDALAPDVRERIAALALLVQCVVDHRGRHRGAADEIALAVSELEPLISMIEARVAELRELDAQLRELDEGRLVRALAAAEARGEPAALRESYLLGLDRLRELEVARATALQTLNRAAELAERSAQLALRVRDEDAEHEREVALALAQLSAS